MALNHNVSNAKEIEIPNPPTDTISCLKFSTSSVPQNYLMAGSWDKSVKIWEITNQGEGVLKTQQIFESHVLDCCWSQDCTKAFVACTNNAGYMWDIISNQVKQIAVHDMPIKTINFIQAPNYSCVMTGSWDKKLRFWDMQSPSPIIEFNLTDKVYCSDVVFPLAVVATADKNISFFDLRDQPKTFKQVVSKLTHQIRSISIFLDKAGGQPCGVAYGNIEGRCAIHVLNGADKDSFTFKCHRNTTVATMHELYIVNVIISHPIHQTIVTMGGDGKLSYWDKSARTRLKTVDPIEKQPVTAGAINSSGNILAYAFGYDWSKGHEYNDQAVKPRLFIRECNSDLTPMKK